MADRKKRLDTNVAGNFFVDATCINCDTCRQLAPGVFEEIGDYSAVVRQPHGEEDLHRAYQALLACPVGCIGTVRSEGGRMQQAKASFPLLIQDEVYYCGFNSDKSFGANSYVIRHPEGNWLVDSPRYSKYLVDWFERMGGIARIFLTHEDDVADADRYARRFGATRIIHREDAHALPDAEWILDGTDPIRLAPHFQVIPLPGHTPGSQALLYRDRFLFSGDHLWWEPDHRRLEAPRQLVWSQEHLLNSFERLLDHCFEWVLAGHGHRVHLSSDELHIQVRDLLDRRRAATPS
jgi:glyoxylase-like metal-dependent hydrolase (beta-lactamase superfamily II)/ferredoxin